MSPPTAAIKLPTRASHDSNILRVRIYHRSRPTQIENSTPVWSIWQVIPVVDVILIFYPDKVAFPPDFCDVFFPHDMVFGVVDMEGIVGWLEYQKRWHIIGCRHRKLGNHNGTVGVG